MKTIALATAALLMAAGGAFAQSAPLLDGPNASDRPSTWQAQPFDAGPNYNSRAGITVRDTRSINSARPTREVPVYRGLGAGTDNGQYMSMPPIVYGK